MGPQTTHDEDRRSFALEKAIQFSGNMGDPREVTKTAGIFEAYLSGRDAFTKPDGPAKDPLPSHIGE